MPVPFLKRSNILASRMLQKAGLTFSQIPQAIQLARETVEQWLQKELENGNAKQVLEVLKGHVQELGPKLLFDKLKDMLLIRLMLHLGIRSALATNIATLILPFVLKKVFEMVRKNPKMQAWWQEQEWKEQVPTPEDIKSSIRKIGQNFAPNRDKPTEDQSLFI